MGSRNSISLSGRKSELKFFFLGLLIFCSLALWSQTSNSDFERIKLFADDSEFSGIAISPDNHSVAVSFRKSQPVKIIDWDTQQVNRELNAGNWASGSMVSFSPTGKYLLLQELEYTDFSQNKKRSVNFEIVDLQSGNSVKKFDNVQDVIIAPDENTAISLNADEITFWNLPSGTKEKSMNIPGTGNAIALSPDGKTLAISHPINSAAIKSQFKKDRKGLKNTVKFKQMVSFYSPESGAMMKTISEFYDVIYNLSYLPEGDMLIVYQTPDIHVQINNRKLSYVNLIDITAQAPLRRGFTSMSLSQPDLKTNEDHQFFAINSKGNRFQEIHLYKYETGELEKRFELGHRLFEKVDGEKIINGSRPAFIFLPDNQSILIAMGNQLIKWNIEFNTSEQ
jgi:hypothetical protein